MNMRKTTKRKGAPKTNYKKFTIAMQKKLLVLFLLFMGALTTLGFRLYAINNEDGDRYSRQILSQQRYDSKTLPFRRGDILDSKGNILASSEKVYNLVIDSKLILEVETTKKGTLADTLRALNECFALETNTISTYIKEHPASSYYVPLKQLTYKEINPFLEQQQTKDNKIAGIFFEEEYKRIYPGNTLACDVIGFLNADNTGAYGLEEYYNDMLNGTTGREYGYLNEEENLERTVKPAVDGYNIQSTIDSNLQTMVEKYLKEFNDTYRDNAREGLGANNAAAIMMEVDTGNVLAMASYPNFNCNSPRDISAYYTEEEIAILKDNEKEKAERAELETENEEKTENEGETENEQETEDEEENSEETKDEPEIKDTYYDVLNKLWRNYCISDTYEPGSTAKTFTVAAALESGSILGTEVYQCNGSLTYADKEIKCHNEYGDGAVTVKNAVAWSCNVALMKIAESIGTGKFSEFQNNFNFGLKTNIDLAGEARTASLLYTKESMKPVDLATNSFGQNFNVTMIQMITGFCSVINGGYYYEPHMVDKITNSSGAVVKNIEPRLLKRTVSESTSRRVRDYLYAVVMEDGGAGNLRTGKTARPAGYAIGGKTGTAETIPRGNGEYVVSFIGYAPADDPQVALYVVIDRPNVLGQDDAALATKVFKNIMTEALPYLGIPMTEELSEDESKQLRDLQTQITASYAMPLEPAATSDETSNSDVATEQNNTSENNVTDTTEETNTPKPGTGEPAWKSYPADPDTGYLKEPGTGRFLDPDTGAYVSEAPQP
jgi:stage V sporulation protein D (sporulation-specific penicillin-binding protein)